MNQLAFLNFESEQKIVANFVVHNVEGVDKILVQGVAGSGKTTIALKTIENLILQTDVSKNNLPDIVLLTFNRKLVDYCRDRLVENPITEPYVNLEDQVTSGKINILRMIDLLPQKHIQRLLQDSEVIEVILKLNKDFINLPFTAIQIYRALNYIKGMSHNELLALEKELPEVEVKIIRQVKRFLFGKYQAYLQNHQFMDRADLVKYYLQKIEEVALFQEILKGQRYNQKDLRSFLKNKSNDENTLLDKFFDWIKNYLYFLFQKTNDQQIFEILNKLQQKSLSGWETTTQLIKAGKERYGLLTGDEALDQCILSLNNPIFIVDEIQDFTRNELQLLIFLWHFLPRRSYRNKIIFLGDLNQMITPTGFSWTYLYDQLNRCAQLFDEQKMPELSFASENENPKLPFRHLVNNYRTTQELAEFANKFSTTLYQAILPKTEVDQVRKFLISPERTAVYTIDQAIYENLSEIDRMPKLIIGNLQLFKRIIQLAIKMVRNDRQFEDQLIIINSYDELANDLDLNNQLREVGELIPGMQAKGLEFSQLVICGLQNAGKNNFNKQDVNLWYMIVTRARVKELILLDKKDFNFFNQYFNNGIKSTGIIVEQADETKLESLARELINVGQNKINSLQAEQLAELKFEQFLNYHIEDDLKKALEYIRFAKNEEKYCEFCGQAGIFYENSSNFNKALFYFKEGKKLLDAIRQLFKLYELESNEIYRQEYEKILSRLVNIEEIIQARLIWQDFQEAFQEIFNKKDEIFIQEQYDICFPKFKDAITGYDDRQSVINTINLIEKNGYVEDAAELWIKINQPLRAVEALLKQGKYQKAKQLVSELRDSPQKKMCWESLLNYQNKKIKNIAEQYFLLDRLGYRSAKLELEYHLKRKGKFLELLEAYLMLGEQEKERINLLIKELESDKKFVELIQVYLKTEAYEEAARKVNQLFRVFLKKLQRQFYPRPFERSETKEKFYYKSLILDYIDYFENNLSTVTLPDQLNAVVDLLKKIRSTVEAVEQSTIPVSDDLKKNLEALWEKRFQDKKLISNWNIQFISLITEIYQNIEKLYQKHIPQRCNYLFHELQKKQVSNEKDAEMLIDHSFQLLSYFREYQRSIIFELVVQNRSLAEGLHFLRNIVGDEKKFIREVKSIKNSSGPRYQQLLIYFVEFNQRKSLDEFFQFLLEEQDRAKLTEQLTLLYQSRLSIFKDQYLRVKSRLSYQALLPVFEAVADNLQLDVNQIHEFSVEELVNKLEAFLRERNGDGEWKHDLYYLQKRLNLNKKTYSRWQAMLDDFEYIKEFEYFNQLHQKMLN